jgi:uncharacterized membrane protein
MNDTPSILTPLNVILLALMLAATAYGFATLPADLLLPVHFDIFGTPDRLAPRNEALLTMPLIAVVLASLFLGLARFAPQHVKGGEHVLQAVLPILLGMFLAFQFVMVLRFEFAIIQVVVVGISALLIVLGNFLPKSQPNRFGGVRTRATLADPVVWAKTHRAVGLAMMISGGLLVLLTLVTSYGPILLGGTLLALLMPILFGALYSGRA